MNNANLLPAYLSETALQDIISAAFSEDLRDGDVTTLATIPRSTQAQAAFLAKESGVISGCTVVDRVFRTLDDHLSVTWQKFDGDWVDKGMIFGEVSGPAHAILSAERIALNLMQRMSGIATATKRMVDAAKPHSARILDTRKTAPGLRLLDKWAVLTGGGHNHRIGLFDMIMIKDNHIAAAGGIRQAIKAAQTYRASCAKPLRIEVETSTLEEVDEVLAVGGIDVIMLDNMAVLETDGSLNISMLSAAVQRIGKRYETEASGNVTEATVGAIAASGVDAISSGALTHSVKALDISLKIELHPQRTTGP